MKKYLGLPMMVERRKKEAFHHYVDRFGKKAQGWGMRFLSIGGKEAAIKAVLQALLVYAMQCFSKSLYNMLERVLIRNSLGLIMVACTYPHYGIVDAFVAKPQACVQAIDFAMELEFKSVQVEGESLTIIKKVPEVQITTLIEMLMGQAMKLDNIAAERDAVAQKSLQGKRVEKCVETLDMLKISNGRAEPVAVTSQPSRKPLILHQCHATMELFD
ncbi:hypothetical protein PVK06_042704 [Gossypium arboreum]|uniref:RNase H type-1 domain-containing protein n=1 Tax=Gossypium arboreum TaxID=29729 RepID=A0ABR0MNJ5_GOSAR|nr:hypothetical protein PVK06_042704 [Gossypium arboreum]